MNLTWPLLALGVVVLLAVITRRTWDSIHFFALGARGGPPLLEIDLGRRQAIVLNGLVRSARITLDDIQTITCQGLTLPAARIHIWLSDGSAISIAGVGDATGIERSLAFIRKMQTPRGRFVALGSRAPVAIDPHRAHSLVRASSSSS